LAPIRAIPALAAVVATVPDEICATFFSWRKTAARASILRRARGVENAVKGVCAAAHTIFSTVKKCPFCGRFCDFRYIARRSRAARAACAPQSQRTSARRSADEAREGASYTFR
jgi:hypothetical protein